jgi:hypothetical protein
MPRAGILETFVLEPEYIAIAADCRGIDDKMSHSRAELPDHFIAGIRNIAFQVEQ